MGCNTLVSIAMRFIKRMIYKSLKRQGYAEYMVKYHGDLIYKDWFTNPEYSLKEKIWAHRRGFLVDRIKVYGLNNDNYTKYLSDYAYHKMYPLNSREHTYMVDDKLTLKETLSKYDEFLPEYYFKSDTEGNITKLQNMPQRLNKVNFGGGGGRY